MAYQCTSSTVGELLTRPVAEMPISICIRERERETAALANASIRAARRIPTRTGSWVPSQHHEMGEGRGRKGKREKEEGG